MLQQVESLVQPRQELLRSEERHASGGELDRQWQTVELTHKLFEDRRCSPAAQVATRPGERAVEQQAKRFGRAIAGARGRVERAEVERMLIRRAQAFAGSAEQPEVRSHSEERFDDLRR